MTSTIGSFSLTGSPSFTNHLTTSPSWTPSPMSGSLNSRAIVSSRAASVASPAVGLAFVLPFRETGTTLLLNALLYFAIGVVLGVAGSGLLRMRAWAWGLAILATLVTLVYVGYTAYQRSTAGEQLSLPAILTLAIVGVTLVYLLSVSRAFRRPAGM